MWNATSQSTCALDNYVEKQDPVRAGRGLLIIQSD